MQTHTIYGGKMLKNIEGEERPLSRPEMRESATRHLFFIGFSAGFMIYCEVIFAKISRREE